MPDTCKFEYFKTPINFSVEDIEGAHLEAFVITGIVNPFGPTLSFLATLGRSEKRPLIYVMLNPFLCEVKQIGTFTSGDTWNPDKEFANLAQFLSGSCPTLILINSSLDPETRYRVTYNIIAHFEDAEPTLENVRDFFGNPMDRVSHSMGMEVPNPEGPPKEVKDAEWNEIISDTRHVWPELEAFMFAWDGSINLTNIPEEMKYGALKADRMKAILIRLMESVWIPKQAPEHGNPSRPKAAFERPLPIPHTLEKVREMLLDRSSWEHLRGDNLLQFLEWSLLLYGSKVDGKIDSSLVPHLMALYNHVKGHSAPEHRKLQLQYISLAAEKADLAACTMLPPLLCEDDPNVVATAMLDYIALSHPDNDGLPIEFSALDQFFGRKVFDCPGGALGGLITSGDRRFHPKLHKWKKRLSKDDIRTATNCRTPFTTHGEIVFWLDWADQLIDRRDAVSESVLGLVASAISLLGKHNPHDVVQDVERRYPASSVESAVVLLQSWDRAEYASVIADRLYRMEAAEAAPKVFSAVLRAWGLEPRADLMDQYISEE